MRKAKPKAPIAPVIALEYGQHHVRLTPELQVWAVAKAYGYRSVAAWITELVRAAYERHQAEDVPLRKAA
jgi:hypothetical protein